MRVHRGCPICRGDVLGSMESGFFCKRCNLLFSKHHIVFEHSRQEIRSMINKHFSGYDRMQKEREKEQPRESVERASQRMGEHLREVKEALPQLKKAAQELERADWPILSEAAVLVIEEQKKTKSKEEPREKRREAPHEERKEAERQKSAAQSLEEKLFGARREQPPANEAAGGKEGARDADKKSEQEACREEQEREGKEIRNILAGS